MSGHSKWATTKRKKAYIDAKRAKVFTKLASLITIAAREGKSGDPNFNPSLRMAVDNAKAVSMPKENIDRAIARGIGGGEAAKIEEAIYEAYGPAGVAMLIETLTDNRNRTIAQIKAALNKFGGSVAGTGSVMFQFKKVGQIVIDQNRNDLKGEVLEEIIINSGADDFAIEDNIILVITIFPDLIQVKKRLEESGIAIDSSEISYLASTSVELLEEQMESVSKLVDTLEELEDVSSVYTNLA